MASMNEKSWDERDFGNEKRTPHEHIGAAVAAFVIIGV
jgi:hypothetical protein